MKQSKHKSEQPRIIVTPQEDVLLDYHLVKDAYNGIGGFKEGYYLFKYDREQDFKTRMNMGTYTNLIKPIVDSRVDPVFVTGTPHRSYKDTTGVVEGFLEDSDTNNSPLIDYVHKATTETVLLGNSFIVVDNFDTVPKTIGEVVSERKYPYIYSKSLTDVHEYEKDPFGKLLSIEFFHSDEQRLVKDSQDKYETVHIYKSFDSHWTSYYSDSESYGRQLIRRTAHGLGEVPVVYYDSEIITFPPYYSMATLARHIYNIDSELNDLQRSQMFNILLLPTRFTGGESDESMVLSSHNAISYDADATHAPSFISPEASIFKVQMENRDRRIETLLQSADVLGTTAIQSGSGATSGIAEGFKFFGKQNALYQSARIANHYGNGVMRIVGLYMNRDFEYEVEYPTNFSPTFAEVSSKIDSITGLIDRHISPLIDSTLNEEVVELLGSVLEIDEELMDKLKESIGDNPQTVNGDEIAPLINK